MKKFSTAPGRRLIAEPIGIVLCAAVTLLLAACGGTPYLDSRREAGQRTPVGASTPDRVAICYSDYSSTAADLQKMAESECAKTGRTAKRDGDEWLVCTLTRPNRAYFQCVSK